MKQHSKKRKLLIIDDDKNFCLAVSDYFSSDELEVLFVHSAKEGMAICSNQVIDVVLLDQKLPDAEGHTLCPEIIEFHEQTKIIFITAFPSFENAVEAIKAGAYDYLSKPFELEELDHAIKQALRTLDLELAEQIGKYKEDKESDKARLIGRSKPFQKIRELVELAASADAPVLITGETGTGKNMVAKAIHYSSNRHKTSFVSVNCAALPENLIEAELFGHEKGAFTGAVASKKGLFEMAEGGTLFLDEIGEMPYLLQSKLLSVLDENKVKRLGGETFRTVDVRVVAATNTDLSTAIRQKKFREDLYYRLSVIRIHLPPLRDRKEDIPELCEYLIKQVNHRHNVEIEPSEYEKLKKYQWPGNVRELRNILERSLLLHRGESINPSELLTDQSHYDSLPSPSDNGFEGSISTLEEVEKNHIKHALEKLSFNYTRTSRALGMSLSTLKRKIKLYGLN